MLHASHNILWSVQIMKLLITQSSPVSRHFLPLRSIYSPQYHVLEHPQSVLPLVWRIKSVKPIQNRQYYSFVLILKFLEWRREAQLWNDLLISALNEQVQWVIQNSKGRNCKVCVLQCNTLFHTCYYPKIGLSFRKGVPFDTGST
jgi:hypothetical protein